jgi:hypothetical protein
MREGQTSEGYAVKISLMIIFLITKRLMCKFRTVVPRPTFEASFFAYQGSDYYKDVDYYAFLSTITNYKIVWFCAWASKDDWLKNPKGVLWKAGQTDPTNNKTFHKDTWSVLYQHLKRFSIIMTPEAYFV